MNCYWYIRVSGKGQLDGEGPDRQRDSIEKFCMAHKIKFAGEFFEQGISGTKEGMDRPAFGEMIATIDASLNPVKIIVVERLDRLARDLMVSEMLLRECRNRGIKVFAVDQGALIDMATDGDDPTRKLIRQLLGALAEWEKSMLVKKLGSARAKIRKLTGKCEGIKFYGELPGEIHTLRVMRMLRESKLTFQVISDMLNEQRLFNRFNNQWTRHSVYQMLKNHPSQENTCVEHTHSS